MEQAPGSPFGLIKPKAKLNVWGPRDYKSWQNSPQLLGTGAEPRLTNNHKLLTNITGWGAIYFVLLISVFGRGGEREF